MKVDTRSRRQVEVLRALGEPIRWRIVERLAAEELCVCHLVDDLGISQPLASHHLKALRDAGVIESERFKQWTYHRLVPDVLAALSDDLRSLAPGSDAGDRRRPCC